MTPKPWGLNHTFIFFCWAELSREAWLCSMWHHSTQLNSLYSQEGASQSCKLVLGIGGPLCRHPHPAAWASSQNGTGNQPTNQVPREWEIKYIRFLKPESGNWMVSPLLTSVQAAQTQIQGAGIAIPSPCRKRATEFWKYTYKLPQSLICHIVYPFTYLFFKSYFEYD